MKAVIDLSEVEDQLTNCKPGDEYSIVFTVDAKTDEQLTGTASEVEHLGQDEGDAENPSEDAAKDEEYPDEQMPKGRMAGPAGRKIPKAILMIAK